MQDIRENTVKKSVYVFEHPKMYVTLGNILDKILYVGTTVTFIVFLTSGLIFRGLIASIILLAICLPILAHLGKCAYKIEFNADSRKARFYLLRKKGIIDVHFDEIEKVKISSVIIFHFRNGTVMYNDVGNKSLIDFLNSIFNIHCGLWGRICQRL